MNLFNELRRRNVFRAMTFYAALSWLLVQVATEVLPYFGIGVHVLRWLVIALVAGFIPAMVFAWFFEWTPHGIKRETEDVPHEAFRLEAGRKLDFWIIGVLSLCLVALLVDAFAPRSEPASSDKSIAVLPFDRGDGNTGEAYFSDGLSEDLITALSQSGQLKVISRNSSFRFRDSKEDSSSIGRQLGVAYLLEGSVRLAGGQVRIIVDLISAADGGTIWSRRYERPYRDLFALQDDITRAVASELNAELVAGNGASVQSDHPRSGNLEAYNAYLQGKFYHARRSEADYRRAIGYYADAARIDPGYALAHAALAYAQIDLAGYYLSGDAALRAYANARLESATALRLDPELALAYGARGRLLQTADWDWAGSEQAFRQQMQLAPNDSTARSDLGNARATMGQLSEAIALTRQSIETDPLRSEGYAALAAYQSALGQLDAAEHSIRRAIELQPSAGYERVQLVIIQLQRGNAQATQAALQQVHDEGGWLEIARAFATQNGSDPAAADTALQVLIDTQSDISAFQIAEVYALRNQPDKVFEWLNRALDIRDPGLARLWFDPFILRYKHDPRFVAFCRKLGLPVTGEAGGVAIAPMQARSTPLAAAGTDKPR